MVKIDTLDVIVYPIIGGVLIAIASSLHLYLKGRVTGFSGILYQLVFREEKDFFWRFGVYLGIVMAASMMRIIDKEVFFENSQQFYNLDLIGYLVSGFFVGFGTKLGNGCTSGHGVCGLPRLTKRSFVAVGSFLLTGIGVATLRIYSPFFNLKNWLVDAQIYMYDDNEFMSNYWGVFMLCLTIVVSIVLTIFVFLKSKKENEDHQFATSDFLIGLLVGFIFGVGLAISGMIRRAKVLGFLALCSEWDPSLLFVLGVAVPINFFTFKWIVKNVEIPKYSTKSICFAKDELDWKVVVGPVFFGLGWGISGICPGPWMADLFYYLPILLCFFVTLVFGQFCAKMFTKKKAVKSDIENKVKS